MVRGRLPRESNPAPGQRQRGFVPAFDSDGNENYVRISPKNPMPTSNYLMTDGGVWVPQKGTEDGIAKHQLTGSNVVFIKTVTVTANSEVVIFIGEGEEIDFDPVGFKSAKIGFNELNARAHKASFDFFDEHTGFDTFYRTAITNVAHMNNIHFAQSQYFNFVGNRLRFRLANNDSVDHTYNVVIKLSKESANDDFDNGLINDSSKVVHKTADINNTSTLALSDSWSRSYTLIINDSDTDIYLSLGGGASLNSGIRLNANGGSYEMSRSNGNLFQGSIYAIHGASGDKKLLITESELL